MRPLLGWMIGGGVGPAALYGIVMISATAVEGIAALPVALSAVMYLAGISVVPGAVAGALIGVVDAVLRGRVARVERPARRGPALRAAAVILVLATGYVTLLMALTPSDWSNPASNVAVAAAVALLPALVSFFLYLRLPEEPVDSNPLPEH